MTYTELEAVNQILAAQGYAPASTIEGDVSKNTQIALNMLRETSKQVQLEGWEFCYDPQYTLSVEESTGEIPYPDTLIRFYVPEERWIQQKSGKLYNRQTKSFTFTYAVTGTAYFVHAWDDIPMEAQSYIAAKAARKTYEQFVGADEGRQSLYLEEQNARKTLQHRDADTGQHSMFDDPAFPILYGSDYIPGAPRRGPY